MEKPLVSIIIPAYNSMDTIKTTIDSCFAQTYTNIEIIVVNDGSSDHTADIVQKYKNIILINKNNEGPYKARLLGILSAKGKYIFFVDADDSIKENCIELLVGKINYYDSDFVQCNSVIKNSELLLDSNKEIIFHYLDETIRSFMPMKLFKKNILLNLVEIDPGTNLAEDVFTSFYYLKQCKKALLISDSLYNYMSWPNHKQRSKQNNTNFKAMRDNLYARCYRHNQYFAFYNEYKIKSAFNIAYFLSKYFNECKLYLYPEFYICKSIIKDQLKYFDRFRTNIFIMIYLPRIYYFAKKFICKIYKKM